MLDAGDLRHRVEIQRRVDVQDPTTGVVSQTWQTQLTDVPAKFSPLTPREFIAAQAQQSQITARFAIRYVAGITSSHRVVHDGRYFYVQGALPDGDSGREFLTLVVSEGQASGT